MITNTYANSPSSPEIYFKTVPLLGELTLLQTPVLNSSVCGLNELYLLLHSQFLLIILLLIPISSLCTFMAFS